jgi:hypothetical protein
MGGHTEFIGFPVDLLECPCPAVASAPSPRLQAAVDAEGRHIEIE